MKSADIIVTNPPFSLFRKYVAQLLKYNKKFLIIGNWNAVSYKENFKAIKKNKMWIGINGSSSFSGFIVPKHYKLYGANTHIDKNGNKIIFVSNICWFTNLDIKKRHEKLDLYKQYNNVDYPKYDNYDAININKTKDIPIDYNGVMGVPITFMDKYNPEQFEILGMVSSAGYNKKIVGIPFIGKKDARPIVNGKTMFARLLIQRKGDAV